MSFQKSEVFKSAFPRKVSREKKKIWKLHVDETCDVATDALLLTLSIADGKNRMLLLLTRVEHPHHGGI